MSKQISQDGKSFSVNLNSEEFESVRMPVCYVSFLSKGDELEDPETKNLGDITFSVNVDAVSYYSDDKRLNVSNKIVRKEVETPVNDVNFSPCMLDVDGDGVVSLSDIDQIYSRASVPLKFDINGDGIANDEDRLLAREYVGTICSVTDDNDVVLYDGVYDHIPDMKWGYSVNRLLRGGHSTRPLFRVFMPVNYFTDENFIDPGNLTLGGGQRFGHNRGNSSSFIKNPSLQKFYSDSGLSTERGEMLVQDMYWSGSEENLKSDIEAFYALGKQMQEDNGINPLEEFYTQPQTKYYLSTVRVSVVYDQSGNNKHAYSRFYKSGENFITTFSDCQMIMVMGELVTNEEGRLSLSTNGYLRGSSNPFGIQEGTNPLPTLAQTSFIASSNDETWDTAYEYAPLSEPNEPVYMYTVKDYTAKKTTAPFEPFYDGPHDAMDNLQLIADHYGFNSFQDIFDGDTGRLKTEFIEQIPESNHNFEYNRAIFYASGQARQGLNTNGNRVYKEFTGNYIKINDTGYPYYMTNISRPVTDPHPGWNAGSGILYTDFVEPTPEGSDAEIEAGRCLGAKDIAIRLLPVAPPAGGDYNRVVGFNKYTDDQTIVTSVRYHDDNVVSGENPGFDFRLNNKRQIKHGPRYFSLNQPPVMLAPAVLSINGAGNEFYEMVAFRYHDEESYESVIAEANAYFGTTPLADASHAPTPES